MNDHRTAKANIVLFRTSTQTKISIPPWACIYLAKPLIESGHRVDIVDAVKDPQWRDTVKAVVHEHTLCAGVTVLTGACIDQALEFSGLVRQNSRCPIVWGGIHCTILPEQTILSPLVDYVVAGDGELPFARLVAAFSSSSRDPVTIPGVVSKAGETRISPAPRDQPHKMPDGDEMVPFGFFDYGPYVAPNPLLGEERTLEIISSRGCPHRCAFCSSSRSGWRPYGVADIVKTLERLKETLAIGGVFFIDENFFVNRKRVEELCRELIRSKLDLKWGSNIRVDYLSGYDDAFIQLLLESGCRLLEMGVESGSPEVLKRISKDVTVEQIKAVATKLRNFDLQVIMNFMYGFPGETVEQMLTTFQLILEIREVNPRIQIRGPSFYTPYPGTEMYDEAVRNGFTPPASLEDWATYEWSPTKTWMHTAGKTELFKAASIFSLYYKMAKKMPWLVPSFQRRVARYRRTHTLTRGDAVLLFIGNRLRPAGRA